MVPKVKERSQTVRIRPILVDINGHVFWRLNCYSEESSILIQVASLGGLFPVIYLHKFWNRMVRSRPAVTESGMQNCCGFVKLQKA
ncbi:hypothetical protein AgCh_018451 [Apium graveolens]